jgi:hypothetical protein
MGRVYCQLQQVGEEGFGCGFVHAVTIAP